MHHRWCRDCRAGNADRDLVTQRAGVVDRGKLIGTEELAVTRAAVQSVDHRAGLGVGESVDGFPDRHIDIARTDVIRVGLQGQQ
jgi:hypothetical protein